MSCRLKFVFLLLVFLLILPVSSTIVAQPATDSQGSLVENGTEDVHLSNRDSSRPSRDDYRRRSPISPKPLSLTAPGFETFSPSAGFIFTSDAEHIQNQEVSFYAEADAVEKEEPSDWGSLSRKGTSRSNPRFSRVSHQKDDCSSATCKDLRSRWASNDLNSLLQRLPFSEDLSQVHVELEDRTAKITGMITSEQSSLLLARLLRLQPGVDQINNQLKIERYSSAAERQRRPAPDNASTGEDLILQPAISTIADPIQFK